MSGSTEELIDVVKQHRVIYDLTHPDYKNIKKRNEVWEEIGKTLGIDGTEVKKKWKNLKDCYGKHLRSEKMPSGEKDNNLDRYKTWPWSHQMEFIKPYLELARSANTRNNDSTMDSTTDDFVIIPKDALKDREREYEDMSAPHPTARTIYRQPGNLSMVARKRKRLAEASAHILPTQQVVNSFEKRKFNEISSYDDIDLIFLGYAKTIKKFSPGRQTMVKFKVAELLMQEELAQQGNDGTQMHNNTPNPGPPSWPHNSPTRRNVYPLRSPEQAESTQNVSAENYTKELSPATWYGHLG